MKVNIRIVPLSKVGAASVETPHWQFWWTAVVQQTFPIKLIMALSCLFSVMTLSWLYDGFVICFYLVVFLAQSEQSWSCSSDFPQSRLSRHRCTAPCPRAAAGSGSGTTRPAPSLDPSDLPTVRGQWRGEGVTITLQDKSHLWHVLYLSQWLLTIHKLL